MNSNKLRLLGSSEKKQKTHVYINKVLWTDVHMWKACKNTCIHNRKLQRYVFFADKIFVIRPYRFKFISVMECIRDEFIFQGLHVYSYSGELSFLFGFVVNTHVFI